MFHRPRCILNTSYIDQLSPNTVRYLLSVMIPLFYFFLVHCFVLDLLTLRIQVVCRPTHTCCTSFYLYAYVFPLSFPIILCSRVPIILDAEFDTHDMYIITFMFIFTIDDTPHNSFYYKCLNVIYRPPSYCVAIIMTTLLMSSTGLCNMSLSVIIRYCRFALDRGIRAGCAAAGSTVRQLDFRRSSVSLVPGCGGVCIWQTIKNNRT